MNAPKDAGTKAETAITRYTQTHGFPHAYRLTLTGTHDTGDIMLTHTPPRAIIQSKAWAEPVSLGQPGPRLLTTWLAQAHTQAAHAGAEHVLLVTKRKGTTDPGQWFTYLTLHDLAILTSAPQPARAHAHAWIATTLNTALYLLRAHGLGTPLPPALSPTELAHVTRFGLHQP